MLDPSAESVESGQGENALVVDQPVQGQDHLQLVPFVHEHVHPQEHNVVHVGFMMPMMFGPILPLLCSGIEQSV